MDNDLGQKMADDWNERATTKTSAISFILDGWQGSEEAFFEQGKAHWEDMLHALSLKGITIPKNAVGLEIGCGIGRCTVYMAQDFLRLYATDVSKNMIDLAPAIDNVIYRVTDTIEYMPPVDFVMSHLVLQHVPKYVFYKYLDEMYDILVSGGIAHFQMHETDTPVEQGNDTLLVRGYTKDELDSHIDKNKWNVIGILYPAGISEIWKWVTLEKK
jgi:cyclopropane fatty-acyl-phospholipid synthase-like methyltransferase